MTNEATHPEGPWPVSWEAARKAQLREWAKATPSQRLQWLEQALRLAAASGALERAETKEKQRRRGLI